MTDTGASATALAAPGIPSLVAAPEARDGRTPISFFGALLMSGAVVAMTVLGLCFLAAIVTGVWWLARQIPVPQAVWHLLQMVRLSN